MACGKKVSKKKAAAKKAKKAKPTKEQQRIMDQIVKCNQDMEALEEKMSRVYAKKVQLEAQLGQ